MISYCLLLVSSTTRCTSYTNCANCLSCRREELQALECEVTNKDCLTNLQWSYINNQLIWEVLHQALNNQLTSRKSQLTTDLNTLCVTGKAYRKSDCYWLTVNYTVEINMENLLTDWVELSLTHNCLLDLTIDLQLYDERARSVDQSAELLLANYESYILTSTIEVAWYHTLTTSSLSCLLTELCTELSLQR